MPSYSNPYLLFEDEGSKLCAYIDNQLARGHLCSYSLSAAAPIFFVESPGKNNRPCVDHCALNTTTICDSFSIPLLIQCISLLFPCKGFSKLDLKTTLNILFISSWDKWMPAFFTLWDFLNTLLCLSVWKMLWLVYSF